MRNEYLMFVDAKGCSKGNSDNSFSMIGVIVEKKYCTDCDGKRSELSDKFCIYKREMMGSTDLTDISLSDILSEKNVFSNEFGNIVDEVIAGLPLLLKQLKFWIVSTTIKQDKKNDKNLYDLAVNNLIKRYYSFLTCKKAQSGGIVVQGRHEKNYERMPQMFFDIYSERSSKFYMYSDIASRINKFMICESYNKEYKMILELSSVINNVLLNVVNAESETILTEPYSNFNKIVSVIREKIYKEELDLLSDNTQKHIDVVLNKYLNESSKLKKQVSVKEKRILERDKEIAELTEEITRLKQQLSCVVKNKKGDNVIYDILSDVDAKIKGIQKQSLVNIKN